MNQRRLKPTLGGMLIGNSNSAAPRWTVRMGDGCIRPQGLHRSYEGLAPTGRPRLASGSTLLGFMHAEGYGVPQNRTEAAKWYRRAAEHGDALAQYELGVIYAQGRRAPKIIDASGMALVWGADADGVSQDYAEAARWYRMAAMQGHYAAQYNVGAMYHGGQGVEQDHAAAVKWYRKAGLVRRQGIRQSRIHVRAWSWGSGAGLLASSQTVEYGRGPMARQCCPVQRGCEVGPQPDLREVARRGTTVRKKSAPAAARVAVVASVVDLPQSDGLAETPQLVRTRSPRLALTN
jgi:hypothetical protein